MKQLLSRVISHAIPLVLTVLWLGGCTPSSTSPTSSPTLAPPTDTPSGESSTPTQASEVIASPSPLPPKVSIGLELIAEGLTAPVALVSPNDGSGRLFIVEQIGLIKILTPDGIVLDAPFLDTRERMVELRERYDERGLLSLAFHPDFQNNSRFFVYYTAPLQEGAPIEWDHTNHISEFTASTDDPNLAAPDSERILLRIDQPYYSHDGGGLAFGPDGYLYIATGDGGPGGDPFHHAQSLDSLLGKILRLDINAAYNIPADNPFATTDGLDEIFAYGFRQPYRISFDPAGNLIVADVGHDVWEEINVIVAGGNYGWNIREGTDCFEPSDPAELFSTCTETGANGEPLLAPVLQYDRSGGLAIIGGYVYQGSALPELVGKYIFADWRAAGGILFAATPSATLDQPWEMEPLTLESDPLRGKYVLGIGQDEEGELYILTTTRGGPTGTTGEVYQLVGIP